MRKARALVVIGVVLVVVAAALPGRGVVPEATLLAGGRWVLPDGFRPARCAVTSNPAPKPPDVASWSDFSCEVSALRPSPDATPRSAIRLWHAGVNRLAAREGDPSPLLVTVLPAWYAYVAVLGVLLLLLTIPSAFFPPKNTDESGQPVSAWYALLSEPEGGFSLARVQLMVWFAPAITMYAASSIPLHRFAELPAQIAVLLGLCGATTLLGAAANPKAAAAFGAQPATPPRAVGAHPFPPSPIDASSPAALPARAATAARPDLTDLVRDWQNQSDFSRYQYLLLALIGSVLLLTRFFDDFSFPDLPKEFVALVGASQATYLGTKAVKTSRGEAESGGAARAA